MQYCINAPHPSLPECRRRRRRSFRVLGGALHRVAHGARDSGGTGSLSLSLSLLSFFLSLSIYRDSGGAGAAAERRARPCSAARSSPIPSREGFP